MTAENHLQPGDRVPEAIFKVREDGEWTVWNAPEIFEDRTVVVFALPGAFTPTCSKSHLPGFAANADALKAAGVDDIYCLSVNDTFVMNAWAKDLNVDGRVKMLPDGNAEFTAGMGMLVGKEHLGFGKRSWRYSMLVRDGVIETSSSRISPTRVIRSRSAASRRCWNICTNRGRRRSNPWPPHLSPGPRRR